MKNQNNKIEIVLNISNTGAFLFINAILIPSGSVKLTELNPCNAVCCETNRKARDVAAAAVTAFDSPNYEALILIKIKIDAHNLIDFTMLRGAMCRNKYQLPSAILHLI